MDYPTEWVNSSRVVEKPDKSLRICIDPKPLNKYIKREHFSIPRPNDILGRLARKKIFTVIDLKDGFWQLKLNKTSSDLCTFNTPIGRYKFCRFPFGLSSAPELFQRKMHEIFGDIDGVDIYFDDLIISAKDDLTHDKILQKVYDRKLSNNIKFSKNTIQT